jgi:hypothetical protein
MWRIGSSAVAMCMLGHPLVSEQREPKMGKQVFLEIDVDLAQAKHHTIAIKDHSKYPLHSRTYCSVIWAPHPYFYLQRASALPWLPFPW